MNPMWAIIHDTWRHSRQQVVFIIMIVLVLGLSVLTVGLVGRTTDGQGVEHVQLAFSEGPARSLESSWVVANVKIRFQRGDHEEFDFKNPESIEELQKTMARQAAVDAEATPPLRRGVEMAIFGFAKAAFTLSMLLFIAACSGYFPSMLESGGIDMVLSKPLNRLQIYLGKFFGGLVLFTALITVSYLVVFVGLGIRTGVWHFGVFFMMPLQIFAASVLYAILSTVGVFFRNGTLCMIVGMVFYLIIDALVSAIISLNRSGILNSWPTVEKVADTIELVTPNFDLLKSNATACVLSFPTMEAKPLLVAGAWLVGSIAVGYWKFSRTDY